MKDCQAIWRWHCHHGCLANRTYKGWRRLALSEGCSSVGRPGHTPTVAINTAAIALVVILIASTCSTKHNLKMGNSVDNVGATVVVAVATLTCNHATIWSFCLHRSGESVPHTNNQNQWR